jgi:DNA-binding LacI/PurR family transcriptional regulator
VSQIDVAELAGVSQAAVSRAFTPGASVSEETRRKVMEAVEKLNYRPNVIARSLIQKSTNMIGLVIMRFTNPFYARIIRDFTRALQSRGYWTLLLNVAGLGEVDETLPMALGYQVDGIIVTSATLSSDLADECARSGTPVVLFNRYSLSSTVNAVVCDGVAGGRLVADALLDAGHQRLAYLAGEAGSSTNRDREEGFLGRLRERGHELAFRMQGDFGYDLAYEVARPLLARDDPPEAIFCANDLMAMAVLDLARFELGVRIPEDLSVVGFDDIPMAAWAGYGLTTVRQPVDRLVATTIDVLLNAIHEPETEATIKMIPPSLTIRSSARLAGPQRGS